MPRPLRVQYPGAIYHFMSRGDHREDVFRDDTDRRTFLETLTEACRKTEWQIHAYCLMNNHFHLIAETPRGNLVAGMKWLLGTYTGRYNRRHQLFGGRYKSLVIDERGGDYLRTACDYARADNDDATLDCPTAGDGQRQLRFTPHGEAQHCRLLEPTPLGEPLQNLASAI